MPLEFFPSLLLFAFTATVTPGPNNIMLLTSGAHFGLRASGPHMAGVLLGHALMTILVSMGLGASFLAWPWANHGLKVASVLYIAWLAWRLMRSGPPAVIDPQGIKTRAKPLNFWQAAAFQWINPKAWVISLASVSAFMATPNLWGGILIALGFIVAGLPGVLLWTWMGQSLNRFLQDKVNLMAFNGVSAILLILSIFPVLSLTLEQSAIAP